MFRAVAAECSRRRTFRLAAVVRLLTALVASAVAGAYLGANAVAAPPKGGAANIAMIGEPQTLDPMSSTADLVGTGVRVTEISPGRVETDLYRTALGESAHTELYQDYSPIRSVEIADLIVTALSMPQHVDIARVEVFPTSQVPAGSRIVKA